jgi:hypothetical protein
LHPIPAAEIGTVAEGLRVVGGLLSPVFPTSPKDARWGLNLANVQANQVFECFVLAGSQLPP